MRLEVTFSSGKFVGFPNVDVKTVRKSNDNKSLGFEFGKEHKNTAEIFLDKVDFIETMED